MHKNFYHTLYPMSDEPLFWIHLNVDFPFNLTGWSDGAQCLKPDKFAEVIEKCRKVAAAIGREM